MDFDVPVAHGIKLKKNEKRDKNLDLDREQKKTIEHEPMIPIVIHALGAVAKWLLQRLND